MRFRLGGRNDNTNIKTTRLRVVFNSYLFHLAHDLCKGVRRSSGNIRKDLAVDLDVCFLCAVDELAVGRSQVAERCVYLYHPKGSVIALLLLASLEGMAPCVEQSFFGCAFLCLASPFESLHIGQQLFSFFMG